MVICSKNLQFVGRNGGLYAIFPASEVIIYDNDTIITVEGLMLYHAINEMKFKHL